MKTKIPVTLIQQWCNVLRSGKYRQAPRRLQSGENDYCCLGVACREFTKDGDLEEYNNVTEDNRTFKQMAGRMPGYQPLAPDWITDVEMDFHKRMGLSLPFLNDSSGYTFNEIADLLEAVYILRVLD